MSILLDVYNDGMGADVFTCVKHSDIKSLRPISTEPEDSRCPFYLATLCTQSCSGCTDKHMLTPFFEITYQICARVCEPCVVLGDNRMVLDTPIDVSQVIETSDADDFPELARRRPH